MVNILKFQIFGPEDFGWMRAQQRLRSDRASAQYGRSLCFVHEETSRVLPFLLNTVTV